MTVLVAAFAGGIAISWRMSQPLIWPWLITAIISVVAATTFRLRHRDDLSFIALISAMTCLGAAWVTLRLDHVAANDLSAIIGDESALVRVDGVATRAPEFRARTNGSMARFDYRAPATYFPMRVNHLLPSDGEAIPVQGNLLVRVDETLPPFHAGDSITVTGFLLRPAMPRNPGEFDYRQFAKSLGQAGILTVSGRDLVRVTPAQRNAIAAQLLRLRDAFRHRASAWLLAHLPETERPQRDALLVSLMVGQRDAEIDQVYESFQRVGLAHILAISGFHLAVLAAFVLIAAQRLGASPIVSGVLVIAAVGAYLLIVEPRMPVLRAGVMTIAGCLAIASGRRLRAGGLVALSALLLLLWRPDQLFNAGFQLTFCVVLALIHLAPLVRERIGGKPNPEAPTTGEMLWEWAKSACAVTITAWLAATPIAAFHFNSIALAGIPMSLVAVPIAAVILMLGFAKIMLGGILPSAALLLGVPLTLLAEGLLLGVTFVERWSWSSINVPPPSALWTMLALAWVCWWCASRKWQRRGVVKLKYTALVMLTLWLCTPLLPLPRWSWLAIGGGSNEALRIDMLAVGDGSCYIIRSANKTLVFDAGSSTDLAAGDRSIVPAMRRLGIRHVDLLCITHANLDHYSAVVEIAETFGVGEVRITPQFMQASLNDPFSPMAYMLAKLVDRRVPIVETASGDAWPLGDAQVECLHPQSTSAFARINDASMVLRITAGSRRVLMTGDIQAAAMAHLMTPHADLHADVMELPHHGSYHDAAVAFVERVDPQTVMQSTGWTRWQSDRWAPHMNSLERLVTVRDGACTVRITRDGEIQIGRFLAPGVIAGGEEVE